MYFESGSCSYPLTATQSEKYEKRLLELIENAKSDEVKELAKIVYSILRSQQGWPRDL